MKKFALLIGLGWSVATLTSCSNSTQSNKDESGPFGGYGSLKALHFGACDSLKGGVTVDFLTLEPADTSVASERIREYLAKDRIAAITSNMDSAVVASSGTKQLNEKNLFSLLLTTYTDFKKDFPEAPGCWQIDQKGDTVMVTSRIVAYKLDLFTFMGGAHPNSFREYVVFDRRTGDVLPPGHFVADSVALLQKAEAAFRKLEGLTQVDNLTAKGYFLNADSTFFLPQNITFTREGVYLYYNPYEIAPYARGPIEFLLPYADLKGVVRKELVF